MRYESSSGVEAEEAVEVVEVLLSVLDLRRRKGREGTRYVGKMVGGEGRETKGMVSAQLVRYESRRS